MHGSCTRQGRKTREIGGSCLGVVGNSQEVEEGPQGREDHGLMRVKEVLGMGREVVAQVSQFPICHSNGASPDHHLQQAGQGQQ